MELKPLVAGALLSCAAGTVVSAETLYDFTLKPTLQNCSLGCGKKMTNSIKLFEQYGPYLEAPLRDALHKVEEWMLAKNFEKPKIPEKRENLVLVSPSMYAATKSTFNPYDDWDDDGAYTVGAYSRDWGFLFNWDVLAMAEGENGDLFLDFEPEDGFQPEDDFWHTVAHEMQHAVQAANGVPSVAPTILWTQESMANHIAAVFVNKVSDYSWISSYSQTLQLPDSVYGREHFFHAIGMELGDEQANYFKNLDARPGIVDGHRGILWLDGFLSEEGLGGLSDFYHRMIAKHAGIPKLFSGEVEPDIYEVPASNLQIAMELGASNEIIERTVAKLAAEYFEAAPKFTGNWSDYEPEQRIHLNIIEIVSSDQPDATRLSVRNVLVGEEDPTQDKYIEAIFASDGQMKKPYNIRVSNAAQAPETSQESQVTTQIRTSPVGIRPLPTCMAAGEKFNILASAPSGLSAGDVFAALNTQPASLNAKPGKLLSDMVYEAPQEAGDYQIILKIPNVNGTMETVTIGETTVKTNGCHIRLVDQDNSIITYDYLAEYSEMKEAGSDDAAYFGDGRIANYTSEDGWIEVKGAAQNVMSQILEGQGGGIPGVSDNGFLKQFSTEDMVKGLDLDALTGGRISQDLRAAAAENPFMKANGNVDFGALAGLKGGQHIGGEAWSMHRMPLTMSERFKWSKIRKIKQSGRKPKKQKTECPTGVGGSDCFRTQFRMGGTDPVEVVYQKDGLPVTVNFGDGIKMSLRYGNFDIRRPPGW